MQGRTVHWVPAIMPNLFKFQAYAAEAELFLETVIAAVMCFQSLSIKLTESCYVQKIRSGEHILRGRHFRNSLDLCAGTSCFLP